MQVGNLIRPLPLSRQFVRDPSLVLYLPLYKRDGLIFQSDDAYGHLATVTGAIWTPQGRRFDAVDDVIIVPDNASLQLANALTVSIWLSSAGATHNGIFKGSETRNASYNYRILHHSTNTVSFGVCVGGVEITHNVADVVTLNTWLCFALTADGTTLNGYKNGVNIKTAAAVGPYDVFSGQTLKVGGDPVFGSSFNGLIGEAWIYNRALTVSEIMRDYLATKWRYGV